MHSERILNMAIVAKRIKNNEEWYENPEFLETIRMPTDIYYITENLPKPNYYTPQKTVETLKDNLRVKSSKYRMKNSQYSNNIQKLNLSEGGKK